MDLSGWRLVLRRLRTRIWSRLAAFAIGAVAVALLAGLAGRVVTASPGIDIGQDSVRGLLQILATSMRSGWMLTPTEMSATATRVLTVNTQPRRLTAR